MEGADPSRAEHPLASLHPSPVQEDPGHSLAAENPARQLGWHKGSPWGCAEQESEQQLSLTRALIC